jgi:hypothetical protein
MLFLGTLRHIRGVLRRSPIACTAHAATPESRPKTLTSAPSSPAAGVVTRSFDLPTNSTRRRKAIRSSAERRGPTAHWSKIIATQDAYLYAWTVNSSPNVPYVETRPYALAMFRCSLAIDIFLALAFGLVIGDLYYTTASREQIIANHKKMGIDVTPLFTSSPPPYGFYLAGMVTCTTGMFLLTHIAVAKLLNRTTIVLDASRLTVRHGPLP